MKMLAVIPVLLLSVACASNGHKIAVQDENYKLCGSHKSDYHFFRTAFEREHADACSNGCVYTASMNKNSDTMERIAGLYYLMNCDYSHGRL